MKQSFFEPLQLPLCIALVIFIMCYIPDVLGKIRQIGDRATIQVDGGINQETAEQAYTAGAAVFVAGTYLFEGEMREKVAKLHAIA